MTPPATRTCAARNAAGGPCRAPVMRAAHFCCSHNGAIPAERRFGSHEQATAAGRLGGRPRKHEQLTLPIDTPDGPPTDPRAVLARAAWAGRIRRGVAALDPAQRVAYDQALDRFPGFVDAVGEVAGAGPWPR